MVLLAVRYSLSFSLRIGRGPWPSSFLLPERMITDMAFAGMTYAARDASRRALKWSDVKRCTTAFPSTDFVPVEITVRSMGLTGAWLRWHPANNKLATAQLHTNRTA